MLCKFCGRARASCKASFVFGGKAKLAVSEAFEFMINNLRDIFPDEIGKSKIAHNAKVRDDLDVQVDKKHIVVGSMADGDEDVSEGSEDADDDVDE